MSKGRLKIYLGYAAGVGKTYQMLGEGQALKAKGVDVVIGYFEPHGRDDTIAKTKGLETISRRNLEYRGSTFEEMDLAAILARKPQVCLVDEFAHTNVPGVEHEKRWHDVLTLLDAGIDVITTMNIQHLESLNDQIQQITGVRVRETIPDWILKHADEVIMIDLSPRALLNRLERGVVYSPEKARAALDNFFREPTLVALREMALRQTAHEVDLRQPFPDGFGPGFTPLADTDPEPRSDERVLIYITSHPHAAALIRRARRVADFLQTDCIVVAIRRRGESESQVASLEKHLNFARGLHTEVHTLKAEAVASAVVDFARSRQVTQVYVSSPDQQPWYRFWGRSIPQQIVRLARDMRVVVVSNRT
ncbi:MAG TPA: histidine kinase [Bryobacteraceae bacterium]|nr:histidine kinase [Bryobacteraceae bacterium]